MDSFVLGQLGVEGGSEQITLLDQHWQAVGAAEHTHTMAHASDDGCANENHLHGMISELRTFALTH